MVKLPLEINPWIQAFQIRNYELGILQDKFPWILSKYINCYYYNKGDTLFYHVVDEGNFLQTSGAIIVQKFRYSRNIFDLVIIDFVKLAEDLIANGWYFTGLFDEYYIKVKGAYESYHFRHNLLIYGFDNDKKTFNAIGYTKERSYRPFIITYDEYINAICSEFDRSRQHYINKKIDKIEFDAFRINPDFQFDFNLSELYNRLNDYYNSVDSYSRDFKGLVYGINSEKAFANYIESFAGYKDEKLDERYSRLYMELKNIMHIRLQYLEKISCIRQGLSEEYEPLAKKQKSIHMLFLKYNITGETEILLRCSSLMREIIDSEVRILRKVLDDISKSLVKMKKEEYC